MGNNWADAGQDSFVKSGDESFEASEGKRVLATSQAIGDSLSLFPPFRATV